MSEVCVCARRREVERNEVLGDWIRNRASRVELLPHSEERREKSPPPPPSPPTVRETQRNLTLFVEI